MLNVSIAGAVRQMRQVANLVWMQMAVLAGQCRHLLPLASLKRGTVQHLVTATLQKQMVTRRRSMVVLLRGVVVVVLQLVAVVIVMAVVAATVTVWVVIQIPKPWRYLQRRSPICCGKRVFRIPTVSPKCGMRL